MKETLINHNCQMLLFQLAVPEETRQRCSVTKLLLSLSFFPRLSPFPCLSLSLPLPGRAQTRCLSLGGREDVKSFHAKKISSVEHHAEMHPPSKFTLHHHTPQTSNTPKDVDLPTSKKSAKDINDLKSEACFLRRKQRILVIHAENKPKTKEEEEEEKRPANAKLHQLFI